MRPMDEINSAAHDGDDAEGSNALESAEKNRNAAGKLGQANKIPDDCRLVHKRGEVVGARTAEGSEQDGAAVVENRQRAGYAQDQKGEVRGCRAYLGRRGERSSAHEDLLFACDGVLAGTKGRSQGVLGTETERRLGKYWNYGGTCLCVPMTLAVKGILLN